MKNRKNSKTVIPVFVLLFLPVILFSQNIQLIGYTSFPDHSKNYDKVGNCVLKKTLSNNILTVELLSQNMQSSKAPEYKCTYLNGVLKITTVWPESRGKDTVYYDKVQKKKVIMHTYTLVSDMHFDGLGPKAKREVFRLKGFKHVPVRICLNSTLYPNCPVKDISYKIYKGIVINRINADGFKDGLWITFYDTGEINEKKHYKNNVFLDGKTYDKNGRDLHYVSESAGGIISVQMDSTR